MLPIKQYMTTRGGLAKNYPLLKAWILPSKFLFPDKTEQAKIPLSSIALATPSGISPVLPIHV